MSDELDLSKIAAFNESVGLAPEEAEPETAPVEEPVTDDQPAAEPEAEPEVEQDEETPTEPETEEVEAPTVEETEPEQPEHKEDKPVQSKEENAKFAEMRRAQKAKEEAEKLLKESPEYRVAKQLSDMYGKPVEQIMRELEEAALQKKAQDENIPVDVLRRIENERKQNQELLKKAQEAEFNLWKSKIDTEAEGLQKSYPFLTPEELDEAKMYLLTDLKNPNMPLKSAVMALHGDKITEALTKAIQQDAIAKATNRAKAPLPPTKGAKPSPTVQLTADEKFAAKALGLSEEEYLKYK